MGVYVIVNKVTGRRYIGSSYDIWKRWIVHRRILRIGKHHSPYLQHSWDKHGEGAFSIELLETVEDRSTLLPREQFWIDHCDATNNIAGFNVNRFAASCLGTPKSAEHKAKISASRLGKPRPAEVLAKLHAGRANHIYTEAERNGARERQLGKLLSPETRAKISAAHKGKKLSPERIERARLARTDWRFTDEQRAKMSAARKGKRKGPMSDETKAKLRTSQLAVQAKLRNDARQSSLTL